MRTRYAVFVALFVALFATCGDHKSLVGPDSNDSTASSQANSLASTSGAATNQCDGRYIDGNPYGCCSNGGNCTWWAWYAATMVWGELPRQPTWGNAAVWAIRAPTYGYPVMPTPAIHTIGVNTTALPGGCSGENCGHVAWVTEILSGNRVRVTEMSCCPTCPYGVSDKIYPASYFNAGFIYPPYCTPGVSSLGNDPSASTTCPSPPPGGTPTITTTSPLPSTSVGASYTQQFQATGGSPPYSWAVVSGSLPGGTTMTSWGLFGGIPNTSGTYSFQVRATDSANRIASNWFNLVVGSSTPPTPPPPGGGPTITTTSPIPQGMAGQPYGFTFLATGGTTPYRWMFWSGNAPLGVTFGQDGSVSGTPASANTYNFTMRVTDSASRSSEKSFSWTVGGASPPPQCNPDGSFQMLLPASGATVSGNVNFRCRIAPGVPVCAGSYIEFRSCAPGRSCPPWTTNIGTGGTDSTVLWDTSSEPNGQHLLSCLLYDPSGFRYSAGALVTVNNQGSSPPPVITSSSPLPQGMVGSFYSFTFQASGGTPPYSWTLTTGNYPNGVTFSPNGQLSGTPQNANIWSFTMRVTDSASRSSEKSFSWTVGGASPPPPQCNPYMSPTFISPANNATVSGTIQVSCTVPNNNQACPGSYMEYVVCGPNGNCPPWTYSIGSGLVPFYASWNTTNVPKGGQSIFCTFHTPQYDNSAMVWVTVQ